MVTSKAKDETEKSVQPDTDETPAKRTTKKRSRKSVKLTAAKKTRSKTAAKKRAKRDDSDAKKRGKTRGRGQSKAAFVRSLPREMPVNEVSERARKNGITLDSSYIHHTRSVDKKKGVKYASMSDFMGRSSGTGVTQSQQVQPGGAGSGGTSTAGRRRGREPVLMQKIEALLTRKPDMSNQQVMATLGCSAGSVSNARKKLSKVLAAQQGTPATAGTTTADVAFYATLKQIGAERAKQLIARFEAAQIS
jgi:hypothetical protein